MKEAKEKSKNSISQEELGRRMTILKLSKSTHVEPRVLNLSECAAGSREWKPVSKLPALPIFSSLATSEKFRIGSHEYGYGYGW